MKPPGLLSWLRSSSPGDISRLARFQLALRGILAEGTKQMAKLAEVEPDHAFQIRNPPHAPRLLVFLGQPVHANQDVDEADEAFLSQQLGRRPVHAGLDLSAIHSGPLGKR
jgi:hypothetical protein